MAQNNWLDEGSTPVPQPTSAAADTSWLDEQSDVAQDNALVRGFKKSSQSIGITKGLVTGDSADTARKVAEATDYARKNPGTKEGAELMDAWNRGDGVTGGVTEVAGEFAKDWRGAKGFIPGVRATAKNLQAMGSGIIEQVPNMIAPVAGMIAGGAAGSAAAGPVGMVLGGWAGASLGNTAVEGGSMVQEALQKDKIDPTDQSAVSAYLDKNGDRILGQAGVKGAIIGAVDTATAGLGHFLLSGPGKAAASRALADMGVDAADKAAVRAAQSSAAFKSRIASDAAYQATQQGANKIARNAGAAALEPAGEFAGEFVGQGVATGEWDAKNAALEAASSIGQSGAMFAGQKAYQALTRPAGAADAQDKADAIIPPWTTEPGAVDPNATQTPPAAPPEAPDLTTAPGAGVERDGMDFTREVDTSGLSLQDPAELERARAATVDYQPGDTTPQWDTQLGATGQRQGLDMPAPEFDTDGLGLDPIRQMVKQAADAGGALSTAAGVALDLGATNAQFLGATGRDVQLRRTGPGVTDESNVIDVDAREVPDQRGIPTARRLTNEQEGDARAAPSQTLALPAPTNLREGLERIRAQRQEAANAQAATSEAAPAAQPVPAARTGAVEAAGVEPAKASTNRTEYVAEVRRQLGDLQPGDVLENDMGDKWTVDVVMRNKAGEVTGFLPREGNPETGEREVLDLDAAGSVLLPTPYLDASGNRKLSQPGKVNRAQPATPAYQKPNGATNVPQAPEAQQSIAQQPQAGGQAIAGPTAAPTAGQSAAPGGSGVQAAGVSNAATAENIGAQDTPAPGAQAAPGNANWAALTPEQRRRARLEHEIATGQTNNGGVVASLRPSAIEKRKQELAAMGDAGKLPSPGQAEPLSADGLAAQNPTVAPASQAQQAAPVAQQAAPNSGVAAPAQETTYNGTRIYPTKVKVGDEVKSMWAAESPDNQRRRAAGERTIGGDSLHDTLEQAQAAAEREAKRDAEQQAAKAGQDAADKARLDAEEARKAANRPKSVVERRKDAILDGPSKIGQGTKRAVITSAVDNGYAIEAKMVYDSAAKKRDQEAVDRASRAGYILGVSNENLPLVKAGNEAKARLKEGKYEKPEYRVYQGSDTKAPFREITKTEYDYAQELKAQREAAPQAAESPTLQTAMGDAGWAGETGQGDTIWTKRANGERYTALLSPDAGSMEVTVLVDAVDTQIASFKVSDPKAAADAANKAVASDVAESTAAAPASAEQRMPVQAIEPKKPATNKPRGVLAKKAEAEAKARADYFTPGNVVQGYSGHDRVIAYNPPGEDGQWSVTVRAVEKQGDTWVDKAGERERAHATPPDAKALKAGPVKQLWSRVPVPATDTGKSAPSAELGNEAGSKSTVDSSQSDAVSVPPTNPAAQPITRAEVTAAQQQAAPKKKPSADQPRAKTDALTEREKAAKAKMLGALGKLAALASKNTRMNWTPEEEQKLLPIVIELFDGAIELGAVTFQKAVAYVRDFIAQGIDQETADAIPFETLQGAYIAVAGRHKDKGVTAKKEVAGFESLEELQAADEPAPADMQTRSSTLTESLYQAIRAGNMPKDNPALKKLVEAFDGQPADQARMKQAQEELETAIAMSARDIVAKGESDKATFDALLRLYESQPNLNIRTSTSVANQAYSTPAPLAFLASRLAGITRDTVAHEPTGGTGMLLIGADPKKALVNELNDLRISALKAQGFAPTQKDAATMLLVPEGTRPDAVVTNPPFGSIKDADGKTVKVKVDGFSIGQIDHLIAARALQTMKDDGKATLILGANKVAGGLNTDDRIFFNWLYSHYNVAGHFEVEGDLYARQGAGWPVRVIAINGRHKSGQWAPVAGTIQRADNWSQVYEQFTKILDGADTAASTSPAPDSAGGGAVAAVTAPAAPGGLRPKGGAGGAGNVAGAGPRAVPDRAEPAAEPVGSVPDEQRINAQSHVPQPQPGKDTAGPARPAQPAGTAALDPSKPAEGNEFQVTYTPRSARKDEGVLIPSNMAQPTQDALSRLEDEVGDIDEFARSELGYATMADLHHALMGLQVDSVAMAIHQIKRGKAAVIADQTGIGKGRQAASIIRWAARQGMTPVFVSVKPSLFTDMYGDLADIGTHDVQPFIMNSDAWVAGEDGSKLFANKPTGHRNTLQRIADTGRLPEGSNAVFMTYSQINVANVQRQALMALAPNAVFVLDESHNAAGASATGDFVIGALDAAKGVTYLSATYAKRPDNMPLYFKTDIGDAAADADGLALAMSSGGLPLQTVVSNNLVKAGQMFRRERSYDGVSIVSKYDAPHRALHERMSDEATKALRAIVSADSQFHEGYVKMIKEELAALGSTVQDSAGNQLEAGVQHTEFSSVVHNFVKQMLLGLKAQAAADDAIESLRRGEKPIIAVENTMGSFLTEYAAAHNIGQGDSLGSFDYRTVLTRALARSRVIIEVGPTGDKVKRPVPLSELDAGTRAAYDEAQKVIDGLTLDIPVSPIDWMRAEITRAGYQVAEITGRSLSVDYSDPKKPVLAAIDLLEQKDKVNTTRQFNAGKLDALILNVAGSTGISLHASEKFEDQRQRHMIVAQAAGDINIFMQMLGRVHRTGQVRLPKYTILSVDLPTEKRPTAVLSIKMKSLNANTSSNTESATSVKSADILNKYGDQIVNQYLQDNAKLARELGLWGEVGQEVQEDIARKATGRLALQPIEVQHAFYDEVESQYAALIDYLNKTNQNDLEPRTFDFDAKETRQEVLFDGPNKDTPFGEDAIYGEYSIKAQGTPMTPAEIQASMAESLGDKTPAKHVDEMLEQMDDQYKQFVGKLAEASRAAAALAAGEYDSTKHDAIGDTLSLNKIIEAAGVTRQIGIEFLRSHAIGKTFRIDINSEPFNAVVTNIRSTHKATGNPYSMSKIQVTVAVNGALRSVSVPATQFHKIEVSSIAPTFRVETLFKEQPPNQRETAKIVTGNLLAAYGELQGVRGTIISFTKQDGTSEQGILLPKLFDFTKNTRGDYRLPDGAAALAFLQKSQDKDIGRFGIMSRDGLLRVLPSGQGVRVQVPKSKLKGAKYFLDAGLIAEAGDFVSSGNFMVAQVYDPQSAIKVLDLLSKKQALYALPSMAEEAKLLTASGDAAFSRSNAAAPRTPAATIRAAITKAYGKLLGQLESKGLVTLTQTEDEAIEAAAQARADKTGGDVAQMKRSLTAAMQGGTTSQNAGNELLFARAPSLDKNIPAFGDIRKPRESLGDVANALSNTTKVLGNRTVSMNLVAGMISTSVDDMVRAKELASKLMQPDAFFERVILDDAGNVIEGQHRVAALRILGAKAIPAVVIKDYMRDFDEIGIGEAVRAAQKMGGDQANQIVGMLAEIYADENGDMAEVALYEPPRGYEKAWQAGIDQLNKGKPGLDIKRSANGAVQGFFDPQTGQSFLIADNLTAEAAPGVLMHEVGIHMAADGSMKALFNRAAMMLKLQRGNPFMKAVQDRMDAAGETSGEEAAAYIAEAYENDRANAPASVQRWLADLLAAVKAWMFKKGIMGADRLTVADIAAVARANARSMARDGGATGGQGFGTAFSRAPAGDQTQTDSFKRWFAGSRVVDADGKPLRVFHGTGGDFSVFSRDRAGATTGAANAGMGFFFTDNAEVAGNYARMSREPQSIMPVYLSLQNPLRMEAKNMMEADRLLQSGLKENNDGAIITVAMRDGGTQTVYMARESSQVKSATGNNGNFDPANPDIRFSRTTDAAKAVGDTLKSITVSNVKERAGFKLTDYLGLGLQALGRRQIVDIYGDMLPLDEYNTLVTQMEADKNEGGAEADKLVTRWAELPDEGKLADLMHEATLAQIDPAKPYVGGDDKAKYAMLAGRFNALSQAAKQVYTDTRDAYQAHHAKVRSAIKERIERSELKGPRKAELLKQMDDEFFAAVKGVYFPLARFGQYAVTVKGADGKVESVSRAETKAEAEALRNNLLSAFPRDKGFTVGRVMLSKDFIADRDAVGRGFMTELYQVLDKQDMDAAQRAELEDTLGQLYLSSLPDLSWAKHGIHRKGTPGFSQDARRAYAQNMFHGSRYLAKLRYSDLMQDELTAMQKHVDDWREVEDFDQNSAQRVVDEMNKRHESLMNPKSNALSTALTSFGFIFHLGLSPASAMVNLSQTALVAYPIMGAKWGFGKASAALLKASAEAAKGKNDITGSLNADERAAYDEAVRAGTIDVTMAHDLAGIAQGEDAGVMWKIRPVMRLASSMFHHAERFNRQVTFVAAYRLARDAGADHKAAFEQATKATYDGHFDYGAANRPRFMQGNVAKVLLLFKQYGQNMVYTLARNAQQSIKGESPEVRAQARKALGGLLAMHAAAAGVLGLPMVTTLLAAASMIGGDDDEPWDAKVALQNMLADTFGQKPAEVLAHGLSRLTPWDISGRVGLDRLIFPDVQEGLEGQRLWESAATQALGPVGGIFGGALKGLDLMSDGHYKLGLEAMLPAVLRQAVKSFRYGMDGAQDKSGVSIKDEVSTPAVVGQLLGFSPSEVRLAQEGKSAVMAHDRALGERRQELLTKAARAAMAKDAEALAEARKEIAGFNEKNSGRRITPLNITQSVRNRQKRIDQSQDGVYLPKSRRDAMEAGRFALGN